MIVRYILIFPLQVKKNSGFKIDTYGTTTTDRGYVEAMQGVNVICIGRWK